MASLAVSAVEALLSAKDYPGLERLLAQAPAREIAALWPALAPLKRLIVFKLLDAARALDVYAALPFRDRYFLLCGFPLQSIAPVLEDLSLAQRRPFVQLPHGFYDRMFRQLAAVPESASWPS